MESYDWMVKNTLQEDWIRRRGILLWLAFFFIELGAGIFFVSSFFSNTLAMLVGWLTCGILGGGMHLLYLGKPLRSWRMLFSSGWKTSWISRGLLFVSLFLIFGLAAIVTGSGSEPFFTLVVLADIFAFCTVIYGGFAMNYINGIPLWNTALLPLLYLVSGLWGGAEVSLGISLARADVGTGLKTEEWIRILLIVFIVLIPVYLISVRYISATGQASVRYMVLGKWAPLFWSGVVMIGMLVPLSAVVTSFVIGLELTPVSYLYFAIFCGLVGDLILRNLILRCGMYSPLIPSQGS